MNAEIKLTQYAHTVGESNLHLQFTPKYRRHIFEDKDVLAECEHQFRIIAAELKVQLAGMGFGLVRVYFYDATKNGTLEPEQYSKQQAFHERLKKDIPELILRTRKLKYIFVNGRLEKAKAKSAFCSNCKPKIGKFLSDAGLQKLSKEKGIDIMLVTDMVKGAFQDRFEVALLATGDADFVPAVELVQTLKKEVVNLHFYAGSSSELRNICNSHKLILVGAKGNCVLR